MSLECDRALTTLWKLTIGFNQCICDAVLVEIATISSTKAVIVAGCWGRSCCVTFFVSILLFTNHFLLSVNDVWCACEHYLYECVWCYVPAERCLLMSWCTWEFSLLPSLLDSSSVTSVSNLVHTDFEHKLQTCIAFRHNQKNIHVIF